MLEKIAEQQITGEANGSSEPKQNIADVFKMLRKSFLFSI